MLEAADLRIGLFSLASRGFGAAASLPTLLLRPRSLLLALQRARGRARAGRDVLLILVLLAAFALRVFRLGHQPLWSDEIYSVAVARRSLSEVWGWVYRDNHPALYWLLLHPFVQLVGDAPFVVRFPSALMGTMTVALTYRTGREVFDSRGVGVFAAMWLTLSPFHIVYSQEARMYAPLALFGIASTFFLCRGVHRERVWDWILYGAAAAATAHSHNYGLLLVAAQSLWALGVLLRRRSAGLAGRSALSALTFLATYAPMIPALRAQMQMPIGSTGVARWGDILAFLQAFGAGFAGFSTPGLTPGSLLIRTALPSAAVAVTLALLGLATRGVRRYTTDSWPGSSTSWSPLLPTVCVLFPPLFVYGYSALTRNAVWQVRGFQMALGCFAILIGAGLWAVRPEGLRWALWLGLAAVAALNLHPHYFERYKSTVPDAVAGLEGRLGAEDILFVAPYWQWTPFRYYYRGPADAIGGWEDGELFRLAGVGTDYADLIDSRTLQVQSEVDNPIVAVGEFAPDKYTRVWTVGHQAGPRHVLDVFGDDVTVMHYDVDTRQWRTVVHPDDITESDLLPSVALSWLHWDNGLRLVGYEWREVPTVGQQATLTLIWRSDEPMMDRLDLRIQLVDTAGGMALQHQVPMISLVTGIPMTALGIRCDFPTTDWRPSSTVVQDVELDLPPHLPALSYRVDVQVLNRRTGEPVGIGGQTAGALGRVMVYRPQEPYPPGRAAVQHRRHVSFGETIGLVGYTLPEALPRPGHHLPVWLHWLARESPSAAYEVHLRLLDGQGETLAETVGLPAGPSFPTSLWKMGDLAQGRFDVQLPPDIEGGEYRLAARLVDAETHRPLVGRRAWSLRAREWVVIGRAEVLPWPLMTEVPAMEHEVDGQFGPAIRLLGYESTGRVTPGGQLTVTLYWWAEAPVDASYHVFVHLVDETENLTAQADGIPGSWLRPTTTWREGEVIVDQHTVDLPADLSQHTYRLYVGLYEPEAQRLPVVSREETLPHGRLLLEAVEVERRE